MSAYQEYVETDTGTVYSSSTVAVYVHHSVDNDGVVQQAGQLQTKTLDDVVRIETFTDEPRSYDDRAVLLAVLVDDVGLFKFNHGDVSREFPESARIPIVVASAGKPAIGCFLAAHGLSNSEIAQLLDVGARTVSQYISDFRKGER